MKKNLFLFLFGFLSIHRGSGAWASRQVSPSGQCLFPRRGGGCSPRNAAHKLLVSALPLPRREKKTALQALSLNDDEAKGVDKSRNAQGVLYMALSSLSFSLMFLGVKLYSSAPTFTLVFYRSIVQAVLSGIVLFMDKEKQDVEESILGPKDVRGLLFLRGLFGSLAVAAFFYAVQCLPLPDAITLQFTTPVFAAIMAVPLLNEELKASDLVGAAVCLSGVLLIARPSWLFGVANASAAATLGTGPTAATLIGLLGAALAAIAYLLVRRIGDRASANVMVLYYAAISALTAPIGAKLLSDSGFDVVGKPSPSELVVFSALGVFGFAGQLLTNMGLTACDSAATATLVTNIQIVFAFLFEIFILKESLSPWSVAGSGVILGYMVLRSIQSEKKKYPDDVLKSAR